jgi:predicted nucleotidyltransferase
MGWEDVRGMTAAATMRQAMISLVQEKTSAVEGLCRKYGVRKLELIGSAADGRFDASGSDLDFLVEFIDLGWEGSFRRYMGLKLDLEELFGRGVDLIETNAITNPHFIRQISKARELLFAA